MRRRKEKVRCEMRKRRRKRRKSKSRSRSKSRRRMDDGCQQNALPAAEREHSPGVSHASNLRG
jgi:hypothetical protein